jgi:hypothetical protein
MKTSLIIALLSLLLLNACGGSSVLQTSPTAVPTARPTPTDTLQPPSPTPWPTITPPPPTVAPQPPTPTPKPPTPTPLPPSPTPLESQAELVAEQSYQDYTVRVYRQFLDENYYFEVLKNGKQIHRQDSWSRFYIGYFHEEYSESIQIGQDITGDGVPNLVISALSGARIYVFELGDTFRPLGEINAGYSDQSHFVDLDGDANLEFVTNEWSFAHWKGNWKTSSADSP